MPFQIITDTASSLSYDYLVKNDVKVVSFKYYFGDEEFDTYVPSNDETWLKSFYARVSKKESAHTSMVNADSFTKAFTEVLDQGKDFIYLAFSSALSGTYNNAVSVREQLQPLYPDRKMYIFDTLSAAQGLALNVDFAVKHRDRGDTLDQIYNWQVENTQKICQWFIVDDLFFLKRGGRISGATAVAGTVLGIKPVLHVSSEGKLVKMDTARGRKGALDALVSRYEKYAVMPKSNKVFIGHADCLEDAEYVKKQIKDKCGTKDFDISFINPLIGVHAGPKAMTVFFYGEGRGD